MFWCGINKNGGIVLKSPYTETFLCSAARKSGEKQDDTKKKKKKKSRKTYKFNESTENLKYNILRHFIKNTIYLSKIVL